MKMGVTVVQPPREGGVSSVSPPPPPPRSSSWSLLAFATAILFTSVALLLLPRRDGVRTLAKMTEKGLRLPAFIASNMVLQREPRAVALWGWATPGAEVTVTLVREGSDDVRHSKKKAPGRFYLRRRRSNREGRSESENVDGAQSSAAAVVARATATTDVVTGAFHLSLPPQPTGFGFALHFVAKHQSVTLHNVAFGEVWLCSGQSNMQFTVAGSFNATEEIADSGNYPNLRLATAKLTSSHHPQPDVPPATDAGGPPYDVSSWAVSAPAAFNPPAPGDPHEPYGGSGGFGWFSATCYFFGRQLYRHFEGEVPVGLVDSDWGGQKVECFSSPDALEDDTCGGTRKKNEKEEEGQEEEQQSMSEPDPELYVYQQGEQQQHPSASSLWNGMIYPLLRMRFAGVAWYQGEANFQDPPGYACRFPAMIADWRVKMDNPNLTFVFVQLAAYPKHDYSETRNAQMSGAELSDVGYAVALDLGDPASPWDCVHPRRKQEVGRRLALAAIHQRYSEGGIDTTTTPSTSSSTNVSVPPIVPPVHFRGPVFVPEKPEIIGGGVGGGVVRLRLRLKPASDGGAPPGTLHAHPTADCALTGSTRCCNEPPFEVRLSSPPSLAFDPPAVGAMASGGRFAVLTAATQADARAACGAAPACVGFTFEWNMVSPLSLSPRNVDSWAGYRGGGGQQRPSRGPPPEGTVFPSVYLQQAAPAGTSVEWDVNASWTSVVRRSDVGDGWWVRAHSFTVEPLHGRDEDKGGGGGRGEGGGGGGGAVVVEVSIPGIAAVRAVDFPDGVNDVNNVNGADDADEAGDAMGVAASSNVYSSGGMLVRVLGVRYAWERYPQCSLYDGAGGWDHREGAIAAAPFCFAGDRPCPPAKIPSP